MGNKKYTMCKNMKILIVMGGFLPGKKFGGPPVSVDNFCSLMKGEADCYIVTHNHDMGEKNSYINIKPGWNDRGNAMVTYLSDEEYNYATFLKVAREIRPDYIYLQGLFQESIFPCLRIANKLGIKVVLAPRGELCAGAFKKKYKKIPYIVLLRLIGLLRNVTFQSTSDEETQAISKYLGASSKRIHLLTNIPSIPHNFPVHRTKEAGDGHLVFVSRILWKKNLLNAICYFKEVKGKVLFDIYGPKEDEDYWKKCEDAINDLPPNISVNYKGVLSHDEIHKVFGQYDAFLFPTLSENYGHVIVEALVAGCIPIISDQTPWSDINEANAGWALSLSDDKKFITAIQEVVDMKDLDLQDKRKAIASYLEDKLRLNELKQRYLTVFYD